MKKLTKKELTEYSEMFSQAFGYGLNSVSILPNRCSGRYLVVFDCFSYLRLDTLDEWFEKYINQEHQKVIKTLESVNQCDIIFRFLYYEAERFVFYGTWWSHNVFEHYGSYVGKDEYKDLGWSHNNYEGTLLGTHRNSMKDIIGYLTATEYLL